MKPAPLLLAAALAASLAACNRPAPPADPAPASGGASATTDAPTSFLGRHVDKALDEARKELREGNISIGDGHNIKINGRRIHSTGNDGLPKAEITPAGDLLIDGKAVAIDDAQRRQLLAYRGEIIGIAEAGMAIGAKGADIAGEALSGVVGVIFGGKEGEEAFEKRMEEHGKRIEAEAMKLCDRMPALLASQQALAESLPEFKPYARMTQEDVDDCGKDGGGSVMSDTDHAQLQEDIRDGIRKTVQAATGRGGASE